MTKEEFIAGYCERSGLTWEYLSRHKVALPCACGEDGCDGWAMISNNEDSIKTHMELYFPSAKEINGDYHRGKKTT